MLRGERTKVEAKIQMESLWAARVELCGFIIGEKGALWGPLGLLKARTRVALASSTGRVQCRKNSRGLV